MYINDFLKNYRANKYLKAGFKNWCNDKNIDLKQTETEWVNIFECDYAEVRARILTSEKKVNLKQKENILEVKQNNIRKTKRGNK